MVSGTGEITGVSEWLKNFPELSPVVGMKTAGGRETCRVEVPVMQKFISVMLFCIPESALTTLILVRRCRAMLLLYSSVFVSNTVRTRKDIAVCSVFNPKFESKAWTELSFFICFLKWVPASSVYLCWLSTCWPSAWKLFCTWLFI